MAKFPRSPRPRAKPSNVPEQLRAAILASGLSQYALAAKSGVADPIICRFLSGQRDLRLETAGRLCAALGLELREKPKSNS